jgi:hypothetical protein
MSLLFYRSSRLVMHRVPGWQVVSQNDLAVDPVSLCHRTHILRLSRAEVLRSLSVLP